MKIINLLEGRRDPAKGRGQPSLNPKKSILQQLQEYAQHAKQVNFMGDSVPYKNMFVSFTAIPKLGVNPKSTYELVGIYAYPIDFVISEISETQNGTPQSSTIPFASDQPYLQVFSIADGANIMLATETDTKIDELRSAIIKMTKVLKDDDVEGAIKHEVNRATTTQRLIKYTISAAGFTNVQNNTIFREAGIDAIIDPGHSIIHVNEPEQAVVLARADGTMSIIKHVATIVNTTLPGEDLVQKTERHHTSLERELGAISMDKDDVRSAIDATESGSRPFDKNWIIKALQTFAKLPKPVQIGRIGRLHAAGFDIISYVRHFNSKLSGDPAEFKKLLFYIKRNITLVNQFVAGTQKIDPTYKNDKLNEVLNHLSIAANTGVELNLFCKQPKFVEFVGKITIAKKNKDMREVSRLYDETKEFLRKQYPFTKNLPNIRWLGDDLTTNLMEFRREIFRTFITNLIVTAPE